MTSHTPNESSRGSAVSASPSEASAGAAAPESPLLPFPTFFMVGAPRCGTTAMNRYLKENDQVCFSVPKETHYFSKILPARELDGPLDRATIQAEYVERFFYRRKRRHRAMGEGAVSYLYSEQAIRRIEELNPQVRYLVMVRSPLEMIPSFHRLLLFYLEEDVEDLARAWSLQAPRQRGEQIPSTNLDPLLLQYRQMGSLGKYTQQLQRLTASERCLIVVHDDLKRDPLSVYKRVLDFIGAEYDGLTEFPSFLSTRLYRSQRLHRLLYRPPTAVGGIEGFVERKVADKRRKKKRLSKRLYKRLLAWNTRTGVPPPTDPKVLDILRDAFREDVALLGELCGRDLRHWVD